MGISYSWSCCAGGSNPDRGTIVGGGVHPTRQLTRFSRPNLFKISPHGEAVNYRPYVSPSFEVAKPGKITAIIIYYLINNYVHVDRKVNDKLNIRP